MRTNNKVGAEQRPKSVNPRTEQNIPGQTERDIPN